MIIVRYPVNAGLVGAEKGQFEEFTDGVDYDLDERSGWLHILDEEDAVIASIAPHTFVSVRVVDVAP
jgi:hypothetical protein